MTLNLYTAAVLYASTLYASTHPSSLIRCTHIIYNPGPADFRLEAALCKCPTFVHWRAQRRNLVTKLVTHAAHAKNIHPTEARVQLPHLLIFGSCLIDSYPAWRSCLLLDTNPLCMRKGESGLDVITPIVMTNMPYSKT
jgi:hypothetical protein